MNKFNTRCPVVERTEETFVEHVDIGGERRRVEFVKPILWIQESETQIQYLHGGKILETGNTHSDWYGYLTSFNDLNPEGYADHYGITTESSLELVLMTTVRQKPATETAATIEENRQRLVNFMPTYLDVPDTWRKEVDSDTYPEKWYPRMEPRVLGEGVTWSSKNTPEQNEALATEFKTKWAIKS